MKCSTVQEQIHSLVEGNGPAWQAWRLRRHCALCPDCRARREQTERLVAELRAGVSRPTPERVRAAIVAALPAPPLPQEADFVMRISRGQERARKRQRMGVGVLSFGLGLSGLLLAPYLFPDFPNVVSGVRDILHGSQAPGAFAPDMPQQRPFADVLAKATKLRAVWKPWAMAHRPLLRQMLRGDKQGREAMLQVFEALPAELPGKGDGMTLHLLQSDNLGFSWQPAVKLSMTFRYNPQSPRFAGKAPRPAPSFEGVAVASDLFMEPKPSNHRDFPNQAQTETRKFHALQVMYGHFPDIELSRSLAWGATQVSLWASGRLTQTTWQENRPLVREVCPPYEELTR